VELGGWRLLLFALGWALIAAATALLLDEKYDYHKAGQEFLKWSDLLKLKSHESVIVMLTAAGVVSLWLSLS